MSSLPSVDGVQQLRALLRRRTEIGAEIGTIRKSMEKLDKLEREFRVLSSEITKSLDDMDVAANGHMGWENRIMWFLTELDRQSSSA